MEELERSKKIERLRNLSDQLKWYRKDRNTIAADFLLRLTPAVIMTLFSIFCFSNGGRPGVKIEKLKNGSQIEVQNYEDNAEIMPFVLLLMASSYLPIVHSSKFEIPNNSSYFSKRIKECKEEKKVLVKELKK